MTTKAIKNVPDETWREFKTMASQKNLSMGELFQQMVVKMKTEPLLPPRTFREILEEAEKKPLLSKRSAASVRRSIREFRRNFRMRV